MTEEGKNSVGKKLCECGCGEIIPATNKMHKPARFKHGHSFKGTCKEKAPNWKGGIHTSTKGYRMIRMPEHPNSRVGYMEEHRVIMEQYLGRLLIPGEEDVHHINGDKQDNRIENLQLLKHGEHSSITNKRDMSDRLCIDCKRGVNICGRNHWYKTPIQNEFLCRMCYFRRLGRSQ